MTWLTWRQHRLAAAAALLMITFTAVLLIPAGVGQRHDLQSLGLAACATGHAGCGQLMSAFEQHAGASLSERVLPWLNFLPGLLGVFVGAPLIARELEQGTYRLVWTQAVSRRRWLITKLVTLAAFTALTATGLTALLTWYRAPMDSVAGRLSPSGFDFEGLAPAMYAVFAFALGAFAGTVLRRTVSAMTVGLISYIVIRESVESWLRPHYQRPVTVTFDSAFGGAAHSSHTGDWVLDNGIADHTGHHLTAAASNDVYRNAGSDVGQYLHTHNLLNWVTYQPAGRFWAFQTIEATIFLAAAAVLLVLTTQWAKRRIS